MELKPAGSELPVELRAYRVAAVLPCSPSPARPNAGFLGTTNTLITETVMKISPVERGIASAEHSFVRLAGAAAAPWPAGKLAETMGIQVPFWVGAVAVALAATASWPSRGRSRRL